MKISATGFSHIGTVRSINQDAVLIHDKLFSFGITEIEIRENTRFFVADGVGGMPSGDVASNFVLKEINQRFAPGSYPERDELMETLIAINRDLLDYSKTEQHLQGMATTLSGMFFSKSEYRIVNAGDSKVLLFRDGKVTQLTVDDVIHVNEIYKPITSYFGGIPHKMVFPFISADTQLWQDGDIFIVTTDGLAHCFSNDQLGAVLSNSKSLGENVNFILGKSLAVGAPDNISCIFIRITNQMNH
ncbi:MAG: serine/threonine-protein phosphatase [Bacteroidales bacterium]|nr:serine/threonine-protein phosphatase [Bacteroidales bacterium]